MDDGETPAPITVVIADDHPVVRNGLRALVESLGGFAVVGEAVDGEQAVRAAQTLHPDVVVMDVQMPGVDGLEATRRITAAAPDVAVLVLTMYEDDDVVFGAMRAGARGYLLKGAEQEEIDRALRGVVAGEAIFGPGVASRVLGYFSAARPSEADLPFPGLTPREREVLDHVAAGTRNASIAQAMHLSGKTVANHLSSIFAKLAVVDRSEAIVRAREQGLGRR
ncbi:MAG: response regulator transcription factor [Nocardioidaceae bacterium]|nr:response regulator transcription factor [Nocardioidaceae bacterium]